MAEYIRVVMLSVGIGEYQHPGINDLTLPPADARARARADVDQGMPERLVRVLLNARATRANMRAGIEWLAQNARADDLAVFFYSGHGARFVDQDSDELDNYDEFLCPYDTGVNGSVETFIRDDELREWLEAVVDQTDRFAILLDSCHSGDAVRLGEAIPKELDSSLVEEMLHSYKRPAKAAGSVPDEEPLAGHMLLAAAEAHQSS